MIDIFICTYNPNQAFLKRTIDAILQQNLNRSEWELTIIDNNSSTPVNEISFIKELKIKVLSEKNPGLTAARKCAVKAARADIIVFVDDDNILEPDYLSWVKKAFVDHHIGILSGAIFPEYEVKPPNWLLQHEEMLAIRRVEGNEVLLTDSTVFNNRFPIGAGMSARRDLLHEFYFGGEDSNLIEGRKGNELSSGEDLDLDYFALEKGYKIGCFPKMRMLHILPAKRLNKQYISKLAVSALKSSYLLNEKWAPVFKHNIYDFIDSQQKYISIKIIYNKILGVFSPNRYLRYKFLTELHRLHKDKTLKATNT